MQRILPPTLFLLLALAALLLAVTVPIAHVVDSPARWFGVPLTVAGLGLTVAGSRRFEVAGTNIKTFDQPDVLVIDGLFSSTRNPMYLGFTIGLVGWATILGTVSGWIAPLAFFIVADRWYIPFEEVRMSQTFGPDYEHYRRHTRRWIGRR